MVAGYPGRNDVAEAELRFANRGTCIGLRFRCFIAALKSRNSRDRNPDCLVAGESFRTSGSADPGNTVQIHTDEEHPEGHFTVRRQCGGE